jgi:5-(carboxyamino)imidazole ribonucleotide synthase
VNFKKEMALVFSRNTRGEFAHYPLVEFQSENGICSSVYVEEKDTLGARKLEQQAVEIARDLSQKLNWVGTAAIEFFLGSDGKLLINEFAPRVHNSGHFSLSASVTSQFENHMRAITDLPLGDCKTAPFAMMKNLIGTQDSKFSHPPEKEAGVQLFWYGKHEMRQGRKMGHVNAYGSLDQKSQIISKVDQIVEKWKLATILEA